MKDLVARDDLAAASTLAEDGEFEAALEKAESAVETLRDLQEDESGDDADQFSHDSWFVGIQSVAQQFEAENDGLEVQLYGDIGFHTFFSPNGSDPTRGVQTAIHVGLAELLEDMHIDADIVEHHFGEVTPETVGKEALAQMDEVTYLSSNTREAVADAIEDRVRQNIEAADGGEQ